MRTLARIILLIVCLGYGIVRGMIQPTQKFFIGVISILYFTSGVCDDLIRDSTFNVGIGHSRPTYWSFLQLACNLSFVMWMIKKNGSRSGSYLEGMNG